MSQEVLLFLLPLFFLLIHGDSTRTQCNHEEKASNDRHGLEEIIFEEVVHGLVGWDGPESIEVDVDAKEPDDKSQGSQLGLEANCHQDDQSCAHDVLQDLQERERKRTTIHRLTSAAYMGTGRGQSVGTSAQQMIQESQNASLEGTPRSTWVQSLWVRVELK